eukprot:scaffold72222_cov54-Phaeocystis_antarctica.AAC.1
MDDGRVKHPVCPKCRKYKVPTTYWCCVECPGNPGAWKRHSVYHKGLKVHRRLTEDGGVTQQQAREIAEEEARNAAQSGDAYDELQAVGKRYVSQQNWRRAARTFREAIALRPDRPQAYFSLGSVLNNSGHYVETAQRFLQAMERRPVGSEDWAVATTWAFNMLTREECAEVAKPEWWNDEGLKALSARVVRAAPTEDEAVDMRALVLSGECYAWVAGPRSAAELKEAIALRPDRPVAYHSLGAALANSGRYVEAAQRFLEAKERYPVGSEDWAQATALAFCMLTREACAEVAKPEWWNDEGLKVLSASVVRAAPDDGVAHQMRATVLSGRAGAWEAGPRSAAELKEAATHFDRAAALHPAPAVKANLAGCAECCRRQANAM